MSLARKVADIVAERGRADGDELAPLLPGLKRQQVFLALSNAERSGWLMVAGYRSRGAESRRACRPLRVYVPTGKNDGQMQAPRIRAASVWDYAQQI